MNDGASTLMPESAHGEIVGQWPWVPDQGDGTFRNPIIFADYSDPDVIRVGEDYFLTASSFNCTPGLPILHSRDLVNWTIVAHAIESLPHPRYTEVQPGCGVWAPALRFHAGRFWIFFPMPDEGIYLVTAEHPAGKWSEPHCVQAARGLIDPCPLWDDNGEAYLVHAYAGSRAGIKHQLRVRPMAPDGSRLLGEGRIVFHKPESHPTLEGPKFLKKDGWYYILAPAGGVERGWQVALRSRSVFGPYEDKIVLEQGSTTINGPHQGALVDTPEREWWFVHFQDLGAYGRIPHLQPVTWQDGWPLMGLDQDGNGVGEPVPQFQKPVVVPAPAIAVPQTSDEFDSGRLGLQWQWLANPSPEWFSLAARKGWLRLYCVRPPAAAVNLWTTPNLLLQKLPARRFSVSVNLDFSGLAAGDRAGIVMMGEDYSYLAAERAAEHCRLIKVVCRQACAREPEIVEEEIRLAVKAIQLRIEVEGDARCTFSYRSDSGKFIPMGNRFTAVRGYWIGAKVGLFGIASIEGQRTGWVDFDYLRFSHQKAD